MDDLDLLLIDDPEPAVAAWLTTFTKECAASDAVIADLGAAFVAECGGDAVEGECDAE